MKSRMQLMAVLGSLWAFTGAARAEAPGEDPFFSMEASAGEALPADLVFPQGRRFPFSFFSVHGEANQRLVAERHVTLSGPVYGGRERQALAEAAEAGLMAIYTMAPREEDGTRWRLDDLRDKSEEEMVAAVRREMTTALADPHEASIAWWYVQPEEVRFWNASEIRYLEVAAQTIREMDPRKRPVWMYDPNHRNASALARTSRHLDIVGKGMYVNYAGQKDARVWCRWTIEQQNQAIADVRPGAVSLAVPEMFQTPDEEEWNTIARWARHDVYGALVSGAQGVVVFSFARRSGFVEAREAYLAAYVTMAEELCGSRDLGQVFLFGRRRDDLDVRVVEGPQTVELLFPSGGVREPIEYPSIGVANLAYGGDRYLFLVNSANEAVRVEISGLPGQGLAMADAFDETALPAGAGTSTLSLALDPLGVRGIRISRR